MPSMAAVSSLSVAAAALEIGNRALRPYSNKFSPKVFTQAQLFALLVVRLQARKDYRGVMKLVSEWSELRNVLQLKKVPHWTTLEKAEKRLLKKVEFAGFLQPPSSVGALSA